MLKPEILLGNLNRALRELKGAAGVLNHKGLDEALAPVLRRLLMAEVLGEMRLIAVAGSQGAGKTTLVSSMYDLDQGEGSWLQANQGRGERLPVLILEQDGIQQPQGYKRVLRAEEGNRARFTLFDEEVSPEQFRQACQCGDTQTLLPILKVPRRHFSDKHMGLLLLPGYEQLDPENKTWQDLMRQGLVGAAGYVLVTDRTRAANHQQQLMLHDALSNEHRSAPVIVITKTESIADAPDEQTALAQSVGSTFGMDVSTASQRVFCAGVDHPDYAQRWLPPFVAMLNSLGPVVTDQRHAQLARLEQVLREDLADVLADIDVPIVHYLSEYGDRKDGSAVVGSYLKAFDSARDSLRRKYRSNVEKGMHELAVSARDNLKHGLSGKEGFFPKIKTLFDTHSEKQLALEAIIRNAWATNEEVTQAFAKALAPLAASAMRTSKLEAGADDDKANELLARVGYPAAGTPADVGSQVSEDDIRNLYAIFSNQKDYDVSINIERSIALLPALGLEYMRVASLLPEIVAVRDGSPIPEADLANAMNTVHENFQKASSAGSKIMRGLAVVMAADFLVDGKIDSVPAIANILTGTAGTAGGAAASGAAPAVLAVGNAVAVAVAVAILVAVALAEVQRYDRAVSSYAHEALAGIVERHVTHFHDAYDDVMEHLRQRLSMCLRTRFHLDQRLMEQDRLARALADVRLYQRDLTDAIGRSGQTINLFASAA